MLIFFLYLIYNNSKNNRSIGIRDWEKYNYFKYHLHTSDEEMRQLLNAGFFTDQKATQDFYKRYPNWPKK